MIAFEVARRLDQQKTYCRTEGEEQASGTWILTSVFLILTRHMDAVSAYRFVPGAGRA